VRVARGSPGADSPSVRCAFLASLTREFSLPPSGLRSNSRPAHSAPGAPARSTVQENAGCARIRVAEALRQRGVLCGVHQPDHPRTGRRTRFAVRRHVDAFASGVKLGGGDRLPSPDKAAEEVGEVGDGRGLGSGDLGLFVVATEAEGGFPVGVGPECGLLFF
jgi:hypothetical protein